MKTIILTPEQNNRISLEITVRDRDYKFLKKMQYSGGFKRFGLSLYDENPKGIKYTNADSARLGDWLSYVFIKEK